VKLRKRYVTLVDSVRESGGEVKIFSSMHVSGERKLTFPCDPYFDTVIKYATWRKVTTCFSNRYQPAISELDQLTGVAAILRFPMPELEDEEDSDHEN